MGPASMHAFTGMHSLGQWESPVPPKVGTPQRPRAQDQAKTVKTCVPSLFIASRCWFRHAQQVQWS